ncbi:MAG: hypothetical protein ACHQXG_03255 [Nitrososphaerales archaeon]
MHKPILCDRRFICSCSLSAVVFLFVVTVSTTVFIPSTFGQRPPNLLSDQSPQLQNATVSSTSTYKNEDFGFMIEYPTSWILQQDNLRLNTIAALSLIRTNIYDFTNTTLAEVDIRVFNNRGNVSAENLTLSDIGTTSQTILNSSKTTLGGLPAWRIIDYTFDGMTTKHMQIWTVLPKHNLRLLIYYIAQPSLYDQYLPVAQHMLNSFKLVK